MIIDTKKLNTKQLIKVYLAITNYTHHEAARLLEMPVDTFRTRLKKQVVKGEYAFRTRLELELTLWLGDLKK